MTMCIVVQMATAIEKLRIACLQRGVKGIHGMGRYSLHNLYTALNSVVSRNRNA